MLVIRKAQFNELGKSSELAYQARLEDHLRKKFPTEAARTDPADWRQRVLNGIDRARSHGIDLKPDIRTFVECLFTYSDDFARNEETSWAAAILDSPDLDGTAKMDRIREYELFDLRT